MRQLRLVCVVLVCLVVTAWGQTPPPDWVQGDVFVGISNNSYQVWHSSNPTAATPVYSQLPTISDGAATSGATKGCGFDLTYRFFGTNSGNNAVDRYSIDNAHPLAQQFSNSGLTPSPTSVQSIAFDGGANLYVGYSSAVNGFGTIERWTKDTTPGSSTRGLYTRTATYPVPVDNTGPGWIDLDSDGVTLFYTSGGSTIRTYNTATTPPAQGTFVSLSGGPTLYALRILAGGAQKQVLVAAGSNVLLVNSSGVVNKIQFGGNSNIQALSLDSSVSTRAWAGDVSSNDFTLVDYVAKVKIATFNTGTGSAGPLGGVCVDGSYSAAEAAAAQTAPPFTATLSPSTKQNPTANTITFTSPFTGAIFTQTLDLSSTIQVTLRDSLVDPSLALSDPNVFSYNPGNPNQGSSLPGNMTCDTSLTSQINPPLPSPKCELFELEANPNSGYTVANTQIQSPITVNGSFFMDSLNLRLLRNLDEDITDDVDISGTKSTSKCVYTTNSQTSDDNDNICSFTPAYGTVFSKSGGTSTITFRLNVASGQCGSSSTTPTDLKPLLMIVQVQPTNHGITPAPVPIQVLIAGNSGGPPVMTLSGNTYQLQVKTTDIPPGFTYFASVVDLASKIKSVATKFTIGK
jgi:hypothetical protein